jgi:hypothetical protein
MHSHNREMFEDQVISETSYRLVESTLTEHEVHVKCNIGKVQMLRKKCNFVAQTVGIETS